MKRQIKKFNVVQTAKIIGLFYLVLMLIIFVIMALVFMVVGQKGSGNAVFFTGFGIMTIILPIIYGIVGFIGTAISCLLYNFLASKFGGIEIETDN